MNWMALYSNGEVREPSSSVVALAAEQLFDALEQYVWPRPQYTSTPQEHALWTGNIECEPPYIFND